MLSFSLNMSLYLGKAGRLPIMIMNTKPFNRIKSMLFILTLLIPILWCFAETHSFTRVTLVKLRVWFFLLKVKIFFKIGKSDVLSVTQKTNK